MNRVSTVRTQKRSSQSCEHSLYFPYFTHVLACSPRTWCVEQLQQLNRELLRHYNNVSRPWTQNMCSQRKLDPVLLAVGNIRSLMVFLVEMSQNSEKNQKRQLLWELLRRRRQYRITVLHENSLFSGCCFLVVNSDDYCVME